MISLLEPHFGDEKNDSALYFNELGIALRKKDRVPDAIRSYKKAVMLDPENPVIRKNLADALVFNKEYAEAADQCRKVLRSNPSFHQARFTLGVSLYRLERHKEALEEFEIVLRMNPGDELAGKYRDAIRKILR